MPTDPDGLTVDGLDWLLPGIQYAESRGVKDPYKAVGDQGKSLGAFQIQPIMYEDIQRIFPQQWGRVSYQQMLSRPELQRSALLSGLQMLQDHYGLQGDALISAWNTGPTKARKGIINKAYVETVKKGLGNAAMTQMKGR